MEIYIILIFITVTTSLSIVLLGINLIMMKIFATWREKTVQTMLFITALILTSIIGSFANQNLTIIHVIAWGIISFLCAVYFKKKIIETPLFDYEERLVKLDLLSNKSQQEESDEKRKNNKKKKIQKSIF